MLSLQDGNTPLMFAAFLGHIGSAALLLGKGADMEAKSSVSLCLPHPRCVSECM